MALPSGVNASHPLAPADSCAGMIDLAKFLPGGGIADVQIGVLLGDDRPPVGGDGDGFGRALIPEGEQSTRPETRSKTRGDAVVGCRAPRRPSCRRRKRPGLRSARRAGSGKSRTAACCRRARDHPLHDLLLRGRLRPPPSSLPLASAGRPGPFPRRSQHRWRRRQASARIDFMARPFSGAWPN